MSSWGRRARALGVVMSLALVAAACGGGGSEDDGAGTVTVMLPSDNTGEIALRTEQAKTFMKDHPDITVKMSIVPAEGYSEKVFTTIAGGQPPDIFNTGEVHIPTIVRKNFGLDLNTFVEKDNFDTSIFYEDVIEGLTFEGKLVGLADNWDTQVMYYNRDLFAQAGLDEPTGDWTWDDFTAAAEALTSGSGDQKVYGAVHETWFVPIFDKIWSDGGEVISEDGTECLMDEPEAVGAIQDIYDLMTAGHAPFPSELGEGGISPLERFIAGKVGMWIGSGRWSAYEIQASETDIDWAIAPIPNGNDHPRANFFHVSLYTIPRTSDSADNAWEFLKYMVSEEGIRQGIENMQGIPSIEALAEDPEFTSDPLVQEHNAFEPFIESLPTVHKAPAVESFGVIDDLIGPTLDTLWNGEAGAQEVLTDLCSQIDDVLAQNQ